MEYVDEDGCSWDSWAEYVYMSDLGMCGCGSPEANIKLIVKILETMDLDVNEKQKAQTKLIRNNIEEVREILLHLLSGDRAELIEHGTSVYGSWLTEKGKKFMREHNVA